MGTPKNKLLLATFILSTAVVLAAGEILLRIAGFAPWESSSSGWGESIYEPDPILGWKPKPGRYTLSSIEAGKPVTVTFDHDRQRLTEPQPQNGRPRVVLVGCSYTEGQWLSDYETFAWKLQARYPSVDVENHGVAGYGTYQSLLLLQRIFSEPNPPKIVLYGLIETHLRRNVATAEWLEGMARAGKRKSPGVPYVSLDDEGTLSRHPPQSYPAWPLREHSALVNFSQKVYFALITRERGWHSEEIFEKLILEMNQLARRNGAQFSVVLLEMAPRGLGRARYLPFFARNNIDYIDCDFPITNGFRIPDGHPNDKMNDRYAECIAKAIDSKITIFSPPQKKPDATAAHSAPGAPLRLN